MVGALSALREVIGVDDKELAERQAREIRRLRNRHWVGPRFALDDGTALDAARAMSSGAAPVQDGTLTGSAAPSATSSAAAELP